MDEHNFRRALREGQPYFGPKLASLQGHPRRHAYMRALVQALHRQRPPGPLRVLEIGSWAGGSAITWATALDECGRDGRVFCLDTWRPAFDRDLDRETVYAEMRKGVEDDQILRLFLHNIRAARIEHRVVVLRGRSDELLAALAPRQFDVVFIDGSHAYADVRSDIQQSLGLVREGGVLCGDDLELTAAELDPQALDAAVASGADYVADPGTGRSFHPGVTAAVGALLPAVSCWDGFWAVQMAGETMPPLELGEDLRVPPHLMGGAPCPGAPDASDDAEAYRFVTIGARHFAVSRALGPVDLLREPLGAREIPPVLLYDDDPQRLRERAAATEAWQRLGLEFLEAGNGYVLFRTASTGYVAALPTTLIADENLDRLRERARALSSGAELPR
jgi:predicted O-methyltransferase YrrM